MSARHCGVECKGLHVRAKFCPLLAFNLYYPAAIPRFSVLKTLDVIVSKTGRRFRVSLQNASIKSKRKTDRAARLCTGGVSWSCFSLSLFLFFFGLPMSGQWLGGDGLKQDGKITAIPSTFGVLGISTSLPTWLFYFPYHYARISRLGSHISFFLSKCALFSL